jgi:sporulation protein YlmC with PRC-barrel domain
LIGNSDIRYHKAIYSFIGMSTKLEEMPENLATADKFTGKKVMDREGIQYGKVKHIHINGETLTVSGVTVHEGFRRDYYLSNDYIDKFTKESLLLNIPPIRVDSQVVDIDDHKIGKVKKLHRNPDTAELESIEVTDGLMHSKIISKSHIWGVGEKIILKITKAQYKQLD